VTYCLRFSGRVVESMVMRATRYNCAERNWLAWGLAEVYPLSLKKYSHARYRTSFP
jgi:hypothetical protein